MRERNRRPERRVSTSTYWALFRWSPLIMLAGIVAGGWLSIRSILVWGVNDGTAEFALDIPIAAVILMLWVWCVVALLRPPRSVMAARNGDVTSSALIWPLGRTMRVWIVTAAPLCGLMTVFGSLLIPSALGLLPDSSANLWPGLPITVAITAAMIALAWVSLRSALIGIELTPSHLVTRGYFFSRRHRRDEIARVSAVRLGLLQILVFGMMRLSPDSAVQIVTTNGTERRLWATASSENDIAIGVEIIARWIPAAAPHG